MLRIIEDEGKVEKIDAAQSDAYFHSRPLDSRIGAWASPQSQVIASRDELARRVEELRRLHPEGVPRPEHWGGYRLIPSVVEFWQGRPSRLHDRVRFRLADGAWKRDRLAP